MFVLCLLIWQPISTAVLGVDNTEEKAFIKRVSSVLSKGHHNVLAVSENASWMLGTVLSDPKARSGHDRGQAFLFNFVSNAWVEINCVVPSSQGRGALSPTGEYFALVSMADPQTLAIGRVADGAFFSSAVFESKIELIALSNECAAVATTNEIRLLRVTKERSFELWYTELTSKASRICLSADGSLVAWQTDGRTNVCRVADGKSLFSEHLHDGLKTRVTLLAIAPDNRTILTCAEDRTCLITNIERPEDRTSIELQYFGACATFNSEGSVACIGTSYKGKFVVPNGGHLYFIDLRDGVLKEDQLIDNRPVGWVASSPLSTRGVAGTSEKIHVFEWPKK